MCQFEESHVTWSESHVRLNTACEFILCGCWTGPFCDSIFLFFYREFYDAKTVIPDVPLPPFDFTGKKGKEKHPVRSHPKLFFFLLEFLDTFSFIEYLSTFVMIVDIVTGPEDAVAAETQPDPANQTQSPGRRLRRAVLRVICRILLDRPPSPAPDSPIYPSRRENLGARGWVSGRSTGPFLECLRPHQKIIRKSTNTAGYHGRSKGDVRTSDGKVGFFTAIGIHCHVIFISD